MAARAEGRSLSESRGGKTELNRKRYLAKYPKRIYILVQRTKNPHELEKPRIPIGWLPKTRA